MNAQVRTVLVVVLVVIAAVCYFFVSNPMWILIVEVGGLAVLVTESMTDG